MSAWRSTFPQRFMRKKNRFFERVFLATFKIRNNFCWTFVNAITIEHVSFRRRDFFLFILDNRCWISYVELRWFHNSPSCFRVYSGIELSSHVENHCFLVCSRLFFFRRNCHFIYALKFNRLWSIEMRCQKPTVYIYKNDNNSLLWLKGYSSRKKNKQKAMRITERARCMLLFLKRQQTEKKHTNIVNESLLSDKRPWNL